MQVHINNIDVFLWSVRYICMFDLIPWYDIQTLNSDIIFLSLEFNSTSL